MSDTTREVMRHDRMVCVRIEADVVNDHEADGHFALTGKATYYFMCDFGEAEVDAPVDRFRLGEVVLVKHLVSEVSYYREDKVLEVDGIKVKPPEYSQPALAQDPETTE